MFGLGVSSELFIYFDYVKFRFQSFDRISWVINTSRTSRLEEKKCSLFDITKCVMYYSYRNESVVARTKVKFGF